MKEVRFFYNPTPLSGMLPPDEAQHATRVLRLGVGDEIFIMDGLGNFHRATVSEATNHRCCYSIDSSEPQQREWQGAIHLALAPTKNIDRTEWFAEKATEIGIDSISLLDCRNSERRVVKTERIHKILIAAMKQSRKAWLPQLNDMQSFDAFIGTTALPRQRFIAHCHEGRRPFLGDLLKPNTDTLVLIGPEGDFTPDEVRHAETAGFISVSLGTSRLRTETAALVATHLMRLANRINEQTDTDE